MSQIVVGDWEDVLFHARRHEWKAFVKNSDLKPVQALGDEYFAWKSRSLIPEHLVFYNTKMDPKELTPRVDRHVCFHELPKPWALWSKEHKLEVLTFKTAREDLLAYLRKQSFDEAAAEYWLDLHPGGRFSTIRAVHQARSLIPEGMIKFQDLKAIWPHGDYSKYSVALGALLGSLGTAKSIKMVENVPTGEAFMLLKGLEKAFINNERNLWMVQQFINGIILKKWQPKAALVLLLHTLLKDSSWNSKSTKKLEPSILDPTIQTFQLLHAS